MTVSRSDYLTAAYLVGMTDPAASAERTAGLTLQQGLAQAALGQAQSLVTNLVPILSARLSAYQAIPAIMGTAGYMAAVNAYLGMAGVPADLGRVHPDPVTTQARIDGLNAAVTAAQAAVTAAALAVTAETTSQTGLQAQLAAVNSRIAAG